MNASIITAIVGAVAGIVGAVGVVAAWPGQRRREKVDIAEAWETHASKLFAQIDALRASLAETEERLADETRRRRELEVRLAAEVAARAALSAEVDRLRTQIKDAGLE